MEEKHTLIHNEQGIVLVVAIMTLALLTMIGIAAMMTSTTDTEITGNEKAYKLAYYNAESGLTAGTEVIMRLDGSEEVFDDAAIDNSSIVVSHGAFLLEPNDVRDRSNSDSITGRDVRIDEQRVWFKDNQTDYVSSPDVTIASINAAIDIDKLASKELPGGATEFGSRALGIGTASFRVLYNIDCVAGIGQIAANHVLGYQYIPR